MIEYITILYRIEDEEEWRKTNPLHYQHHGLKAVQVAAYDAFEQIEQLEKAKQQGEEE